MSEYLLGSPAECQHESVKFTPTPHLSHYGREDCAACGKFLRWAPRPETIAQRGRNFDTISALQSAELSAWETSFIESLLRQGNKLTPKQQEVLNKLAQKYGKASGY